MAVKATKPSIQTTTKSAVKAKLSRGPNGRTSVRFNPESGQFALIDFNSAIEKPKAAFKPCVAALIVNESFKGCALVVMGSEFLSEGKTCRVQVGKLAPLKAEIKWSKEIDNNIFKIGLNYLE